MVRCHYFLNNEYLLNAPINVFISVPGSPDLASHVRSLRGTVFELSAQDPGRLSLGSEQGDIVLEDTGGDDIEETC